MSKEIGSTCLNAEPGLKTDKCKQFGFETITKATAPLETSF